MIPATVIAIEGPDKCGKATQTKILSEHLRDEGWSVKTVEVPVNDQVTYRLIYRMLRSGAARTHPRLFQFVQFMNKYLWQLLILPFLMWKYDFIVMDRWAASSIVYGRATDISEGFLMWTYERLIKADATIVLMGRSHKARRADDSYESDDLLQQRVRMEYGIWSTEEEKAVQVSNAGGREAVTERILDALGTKGYDLL